jgi:hypothetical protein
MIMAYARSGQWLVKPSWNMPGTWLALQMLSLVGLAYLMCSELDGYLFWLTLYAHMRLSETWHSVDVLHSTKL